MTLRFYARHDHRVLYPGLKTPAGQPPIYLGRDFIRAADGKPAMAPATQAAIECKFGDPVANRIIRLMTIDAVDAPFFCADEQTANATGLPYLSPVFEEGVWSELPPRAEEPSPDSE